MTRVSNSISVLTVCIVVVIVSAFAVQAEEAPLPKLVFTHAMGMMPAVNWYSANDLFPLNDFARTKDPKDFAVVYGGGGRIAGLGFYYGFLRADSTYNVNEPYQLWFERGKTAAHPGFTPYAKSQLENKYRWNLEMAEGMELDIKRGDRLDFIVHANGGASATVTLKPEIELTMGNTLLP